MNNTTTTIFNINLKKGSYSIDVCNDVTKEDMRFSTFKFKTIREHITAICKFGNDDVRKFKFTLINEQ